MVSPQNNKGLTNATLLPFLDWFQANGGGIDPSSTNIVTFPASEGGRGLIALEDIPEGRVLFTIPCSLLLSTQTSSLPSLFGLEAWKNLRLHEGWSGLMLCMMWEAAQGPSSRWKQYLDILPTAFDTPMFWTDGELIELQGTSVVGRLAWIHDSCQLLTPQFVEKLGKKEAEKDYTERILPALQCRPDLFLPSDLSKYYSLDAYHVMGSRILSRSFDMEKWDSEDESEEDANRSLGSAMDIDTRTHPVPSTSANGETGEIEEVEGLEGDEDDDVHDSSDIAMVPMADILNARYESENAKLFYGRTELKMISTKPIKKGEQIWNTYGDLPNSELLRRYGHVDLLPLPQGGDGNPGDLAEIKADVLVSTALASNQQLSEDSVQERINWWLEEGGDDTFAFDFDFEFPPAPLSLARLLLLSDEDWEKARDKGKPPKPKLDFEVLVILQDVLRKRLESYTTTLDTDEELLRTELSLNQRHAIIVRLGEKRVLDGFLKKIAFIQEAEKPQGNRKLKRKVESEATSRSQKKVRQR